MLGPSFRMRSSSKRCLFTSDVYFVSPLQNLSQIYHYPSPKRFLIHQHHILIMYLSSDNDSVSLWRVLVLLTAQIQS